MVAELREGQAVQPVLVEVFLTEVADGLAERLALGRSDGRSLPPATLRGVRKAIGKGQHGLVALATGRLCVVRCPATCAMGHRLIEGASLEGTNPGFSGTILS